MPAGVQQRGATIAKSAATAVGYVRAAVTATMSSTGGNSMGERGKAMTS